MTFTHGHRLGVRHGGRYTPTYSVWRAMKCRCISPTSKDYPRYGGRGIKVCDRWATSFENFLADMGEKPSPRHTIDRINRDGDYEPGNCRWATSAEQNRNLPTNRYIEFGGKRMVLTDWAREIGAGPGTIAYRLKNGWPIEVALTAPPGTKLRAYLGGGR